MEEKQTIPLPPEPSAAGRKRTIAIAAGAVLAVAVGAVSVVAVAGGSSRPRKPALGAAGASDNPAPYVADSDGGYSQQPQFTWSPRPGAPSPTTPTAPATASAPSSAPVADPPPPSGQVSAPSHPASVAAPPAKTATKPPVSTAGTPPPPPVTTKAPASYQISGTVSCVSGHSVEGVWVQASQGSGYSPWQGIGNGSTSRYWYTLPSTMSFSLHVGCGGTTASWAVALTTPQTPGPVANFTCHDVSGQAEYGTCELQ